MQPPSPTESRPNGISPDTVRALLKFRDERGWAKHHNPKDLAESVVIEAAELLECFQWKAPETELSPREKAAAALEIADVASYLVLIAERLGVNLDLAIAAKLALLEKRYPAAALCEEPSLDNYAKLRESARSREAILALPEMATLTGFRAFLGNNRAGEWAAASDNRIYFVRYARETVDFWNAAETLDKKLREMLPPEALKKSLPDDFPERPDAEALAKLDLPGLILFLGRLARLEHIRDGVILSAAESGVLARALAELSKKAGFAGNPPPDR